MRYILLALAAVDLTLAGAWGYFTFGVPGLAGPSADIPDELVAAGALLFLLIAGYVLPVLWFGDEFPDTRKGGGDGKA